MADDVQIAVGGLPANAPLRIPSVGSASSRPNHTCGRSNAVTDHQRAAGQTGTARASRSTSSAEARSSHGQVRPGAADHFSDEISSAAPTTTSYKSASDTSSMEQRVVAIADEQVEHARADG